MWTIWAMASWALPLNNPHIVNLVADPKELEPYNQLYLHSWTMAHFERMLREFQRSVALEPLIPAGAPLDYVPHTGTTMVKKVS